MNKVAITPIILAFLVSACQATEFEPIITFTAEPTPLKIFRPTESATFTATPTITPDPQEMREVTEAVVVEELGTIEIIVNSKLIEGRIIEQSEVWEGEIRSRDFVNPGLRVSGPTELSRNLAAYSAVFGFLRQWQRVRFDLPSGGSIEQILADFDYVNSDGTRYTVRYRIPAVAGDETTPSQNVVGFAAHPVLGAKYTVRMIIIDPRWTTTSQSLIEAFTGVSPFCETHEACALLVGGVGDNKVSLQDLFEIFGGRAGDFVDLSERAWVEGVFIQ